MSNFPPPISLERAAQRVKEQREQMRKGVAERKAAEQYNEKKRASQWEQLLGGIKQGLTNWKKVL